MKHKPSTWDLVMAALLSIFVVLILLVAHNLYQAEALEVPAAKMMADWHQLERLARENPYQGRQDHGSR